MIEFIYNIILLIINSIIDLFIIDNIVEFMLLPATTVIAFAVFICLAVMVATPFALVFYIIYYSIEWFVNKKR